MLHDAVLEATCDGDGCSASVFVEMEFVYFDYSGKSGQYEHDDSKIEATLVEDHEWVIVEDDNDDTPNKHYCCGGCVPLTCTIVPDVV